MKSPLTLVKERFGDKEKLVAAVQALATKDLWLDRVSEEKGLAHVSNQKLLKLHTALSAAKQQFGSRAKLVEAILGLENRAKDSGLKARLDGYSLPALLDTHRAATRRAKSAKAKAASAKPAAPKKRLLRSKKSQAKAAASK
jgi:hypothetical protein